MWVACRLRSRGCERKLRQRALSILLSGLRNELVQWLHEDERVEALHPKIGTRGKRHVWGEAAGWISLPPCVPNTFTCNLYLHSGLKRRRKVLMSRLHRQVLYQIEEMRNIKFCVPCWSTVSFTNERDSNCLKVELTIKCHRGFFVLSQRYQRHLYCYSIKYNIVRTI